MICKLRPQQAIQPSEKCLALAPVVRHERCGIALGVLVAIEVRFGHLVILGNQRRDLRLAPGPAPITEWRTCTRIPGRPRTQDAGAGCYQNW